MPLIPITPKLPLVDIAAIRSQAEDGIGACLKRIEEEFNKTTESWTTPVEFDVIPAAGSGGDLVGEVSTDNEIYGYVNNGTSAHSIFPRNGKFLRFSAGYSPKTQPGFLGSSAGGKSGEAVFAKGVAHPGSQARNFDSAVVDAVQSEVVDILTTALTNE